GFFGFALSATVARVSLSRRVFNGGIRRCRQLAYPTIGAGASARPRHQSLHLLLRRCDAYRKSPGRLPGERAGRSDRALGPGQRARRLCAVRLLRPSGSPVLKLIGKNSTGSGSDRVDLPACAHPVATAPGTVKSRYFPPVGYREAALPQLSNLKLTMRVL